MSDENNNRFLLRFIGVVLCGWLVMITVVTWRLPTAQSETPTKKAEPVGYLTADVLRDFPLALHRERVTVLERLAKIDRAATEAFRRKQSKTVYDVLADKVCELRQRLLNLGVGEASGREVLLTREGSIRDVYFVDGKVTETYRVYERDGYALAVHTRTAGREPVQRRETR